MKQPAHPWDRQPGEGPKAFTYFQAFKDIGLSRNLQKVAEKTGKTYHTIEGLSARNNWKERAVAWDNHLAEIRQKKTIENQTRLAQVFEGEINAYIAHVGERLKMTDPADIDTKDLPRFFDIGWKIAQDYYRNHGLSPVETVQETAGQSFPDLEAMTPEERRDLLIEMKLEIERELGDG